MEQRPGAAELWALLGPGLSRGPGQPQRRRSHEQQGASGDCPQNIASQEPHLPASMLVSLPWHDRFLQIHFLKVEWCQANHATASFPCVVLVDGGGCRFRRIWIPVRHLKEYFAHLDLPKCNLDLGPSTVKTICWEPGYTHEDLRTSYLCQTHPGVSLPILCEPFSCLVPKVDLYPVLRLSWNVTSPQNFPDPSPSPV